MLVRHTSFVLRLRALPEILSLPGPLEVFLSTLKEPLAPRVVRFPRKKILPSFRSLTFHLSPLRF